MVVGFVNSCTVCNQMNPAVGCKVSPGLYPEPARPGQEVMIDFTDMGDRVDQKRNLLLAVDATPADWKLTHVHRRMQLQ